MELYALFAALGLIEVTVAMILKEDPFLKWFLGLTGSALLVVANCGIGAASARLPSPGLGEQATVLAVYPSFKPEEEGAHVFVLKLENGKEGRLTSKCFGSGAFHLKPGDTIFMMKSGPRSLALASLEESEEK